jgi:hypothetical protein
MPSTYTTSLRLEIQATGENRASWGTKANANFNMLEEGLSGLKIITMTDANLTLTKVNAATDQSRPMFLRFNGTLTQNRSVVIPSVTKLYFLQNATTGGKNIVITNTAGTTPFTLIPGQWKLIFTDGTNIWSNENLPTVSQLTQRWDITPKVASNGVMEVGRYIDFHNANVEEEAGVGYDVRLETGGTQTDLYVTSNSGSAGKLWHAINDGPGSGLNADTVDGFHAADINFPTGTLMLFVQTAAPTGWVKSTSHNNKALRVTNSTVTSGGTVTFDAVFGTATATSSVALTEAQMPVHLHSFSDSSGTVGNASATHTHLLNGSGAITTYAGAHTHKVNIYSGDGGATTRVGGAATNTSSLIGEMSTDAASVEHRHDLEGSTGGQSATHTHTVSVSGNTGNKGGGGTHGHTVNLNVQYVDVIIASKA